MIRTVPSPLVRPADAAGGLWLKSAVGVAVNWDKDQKPTSPAHKHIAVKAILLAVFGDLSTPVSSFVPPSSNRSIATQFQPAGLTLFDGPLEERGGAVDSVCELAIREGQEESHHDPKVRN